MYERFYGLSASPFSLLPDPDFLYLSARHRRALNLLEYTMLSFAGFVVVSGEVGVGKTTVIRRFLRSPRLSQVTVGLVTNASAVQGNLMQFVSMAFALDHGDDDSISLYNRFAGFVINQYREGKRTLLIFDEAQNLSAQMLEEMRMLSNINNEKDPLLQILLVGQPELLETLNLPELRQFTQRIGAHCHLGPMALPDTVKYIRFRLAQAGGRSELFDGLACAAVHYFSGGVPRLVNLLCDQALVYGFADGRTILSWDLVAEVAADRAGGGLSPFRPADGLDRNRLREMIAQSPGAGDAILEGWRGAVTEPRSSVGDSDVAGELPDIEPRLSVGGPLPAAVPDDGGPALHLSPPDDGPVLDEAPFDTGESSPFEPGESLDRDQPHEAAAPSPEDAAASLNGQNGDVAELRPSLGDLDFAAEPSDAEAPPPIGEPAPSPSSDDVEPDLHLGSADDGPVLDEVIVDAGESPLLEPAESLDRDQPHEAAVQSPEAVAEGLDDQSDGVAEPRPSLGGSEVAGGPPDAETVAPAADEPAPAPGLSDAEPALSAAAPDSGSTLDEPTVDSGELSLFEPEESPERDHGTVVPRPEDETATLDGQSDGVAEPPPSLGEAEIVDKPSDAETTPQTGEPASPPSSEEGEPASQPELAAQSAEKADATPDGQSAALTEPAPETADVAVAPLVADAALRAVAPTPSRGPGAYRPMMTGATLLNEPSDSVAEPQGAGRLWSSVCLAVSLAALAGMFLSPLEAVWPKWSRPEYSQGYIVPILALWIICHDLGRPRAPPTPSWWGCLGIAGGFLLLLLGQASTFDSAALFGFVLALAGVILIFVGPKAAMSGIPGLIFLCFAIPPPDDLYAKASTALQLTASKLATHTLDLFKMPALLDGDAIDFGSFHLPIDEACGGLNYVLPLLSIGFLAALMLKDRVWKRVVLFLSAILVIILMTVLRIVLTGILADLRGSGVAETFVHASPGWAVFVICVVLLLGEMLLLRRVQRLSGSGLRLDYFQRPALSSEALPSRLGPAVLVGTLLAVVLAIAAQIGVRIGWSALHQAAERFL